jgi:hypothetical protein
LRELISPRGAVVTPAPERPARWMLSRAGIINVYQKSRVAFLRKRKNHRGSKDFATAGFFRLKKHDD